MDRPEITRQRMARLKRLLRGGVDIDTAAGQAGVTPYVARLIWENRRLRREAPMAQRSTDKQLRSPSNGVDAATVRRVQRMLQSGWLPVRQIAIEAGCSLDLVYAIRAGRREAVTTDRPLLNPGERFVRRPVRCKLCGGLTSVLPCRTCRAERQARAGQTLLDLLGGATEPSRAESGVALESMRQVILSHQHGDRIMERLLPRMANEVDQFFAARNRREHVIRRAEALFDQATDSGRQPSRKSGEVDPLLRAAIRPLVGRIYDELNSKLDEDAQSLRN